LKPAKEKQITYKGKPIRISADISTETLNDRRAHNGIFHALKKNNCKPELLYSPVVLQNP
jgi:hypothetical protein